MLLYSVSLHRACEELVRTLGFDWLLMFMEEHLHSSTVTAALWILVVLLSNQSILNRFREGLCGGGWLDHTDSVLTNKIGTVLGESGWLMTVADSPFSKRQYVAQHYDSVIHVHCWSRTHSNNVQCIYTVCCNMAQQTPLLILATFSIGVGLRSVNRKLRNLCAVQPRVCCFISCLPALPAAVNIDRAQCFSACHSWFLKPFCVQIIDNIL